MSGSSIIVAQPSNPTALVLVFHGVGASAADLLPLGQSIASGCPQAMVVSVDAPHASSLGAGREWFSVVGVTEENRPVRVAQALASFEAAVAQWQAQAGLDASRTVLVGFSQGAIMSLEATQSHDLAALVVAIAGRFAQPPRRAPQGVAFRFIHGERDGVIPAQHSADAAKRLRELGGDVSVALVPGLGHGIDARAASLVLEAVRSATADFAPAAG